MKKAFTINYNPISLFGLTKLVWELNSVDQDVGERFERNNLISDIRFLKEDIVYKVATFNIYFLKLFAEEQTIDFYNNVKSLTA